MNSISALCSDLLHVFFRKSCRNRLSQKMKLTVFVASLTHDRFLPLVDRTFDLDRGYGFDVRTLFEETVIERVQ